MINVGLASMAQSVQAQGVPVVDVDWQPPAGGRPPACARTQSGVDIDAANAEVCRRIKTGRPVLVGMGIASEVIPGMHDRMILHAGPPITWERMCGPQRGAVMGALIYEGLAADEAEAAKLAASGRDRVLPLPPPPRRRPDGGRGLALACRCSSSRTRPSATGPTARRTRAWARCCATAAWAPEVYARLKWMETDLYPALDRALQTLPDGIDLRSLIAQAHAHGRRMPQPQPRRHLALPARHRPGAGAHQPGQRDAWPR